MFRNSLRSLSIATVTLTLGLAATPVLQAVALQSPATILAQVAPTNNSEKIRLNLTEKQKEQIETIREKQQQKIADVLVGEQRTRFLQSLQAGQKMKQALRSLNLTEQQQRQVREITEETRKEIYNTVLTPEQRQLLQKRQ
ncbi:hypothetical protein BST81_05775 [Leptolyngbya sp. 'hensonii']|uniref:hypothetical protein n=1 Tax=Leptolyngbya sp. 'hensonii' TaxID=1922337 RepID=UPI0009502AF7|nr:hypothetical protein [Leptolyngbya sp. 'hensonii']OLP19268.1 hypothetical protein BST81_05775 [Leptolyngbya sp. 'hensonii']